VPWPRGASAALLLTGNAQIWELAALQALYGLAEAFFGPAATAVVPQTVDPGSLQQANALMGLSGNLAMVVGPAVAGVIVATIGPGWGLAADAASFVGSAACLAVLRLDPVTVTPRSSMLVRAAGGLGCLPLARLAVDHGGVLHALHRVLLRAASVLGPQVARLSLGGPGAWAAISVALGWAPSPAGCSACVCARAIRCGWRSRSSW